MAAALNDVTTLSCFHAWKHSLSQSQSSKEVHLEQFFDHVDWGTLHYGSQAKPSIVNCWITKTYREEMTTHYQITVQFVFM